VEYRLHTVVCPCCEHASTAALPPAVPRGAFGPRLVAIVALMAGGYRLSKRTIATAVSDLFGVEMSLGAVSRCEQVQSQVLVQPVEQAIEHVREQAVVHADETGWTQRRSRAWLWVAATNLMTVFLVQRRRSGEAARALLGTFRGILVSDRWSAYLPWPLQQRQLCWAHLKRDFHFISERGSEAGWIGEELLENTRKLFALWHAVRDGTLSWAVFRRNVRPVRDEIEMLFDIGARCDDAKVSGMCAELLKVKDALWSFVRVRGVEPTNNLAERSLRHAVLWRKASFGTHSANGSRFVERMLTVVTSLRQQNRSVLDYLASANQAQLEGRLPPSLLSNTH
jgi:transposase